MIKMIKKSDVHKNTPITDNFLMFEHMCECDQCDYFLLDERLYPKLEIIREKIGGIPLRINSGYRCPAYNEKVGGAKKSQHLEGWAVDVSVPSDGSMKILDDIARYGEELGFNGIGRYWRWVHLDLRNTPARWDMRK